MMSGCNPHDAKLGTSKDAIKKKTKISLFGLLDGPKPRKQRDDMQVD